MLGISVLETVRYWPNRSRTSPGQSVCYYTIDNEGQDMERPSVNVRPRFMRSVAPTTLPHRSGSSLRSVLHTISTTQSQSCFHSNLIILETHILSADLGFRVTIEPPFITNYFSVLEALKYREAECNIQLHMQVRTGL